MRAGVDAGFWSRCQQHQASEARPRWRARYRAQDVRQFNKDATKISTTGSDINVGPHS